LSSTIALKVFVMLYLFIKAALSGIIVAAVSEIAKRYPGFGGLVASLPLVSVLGMIWLWRDTHDAVRMASHARGTFWFVIPSLPMFLLIPFLLERGFGFWTTLAVGCVLTVASYAAMTALAPKVGITL
jgi:hypothetical protein